MHACVQLLDNPLLQRQLLQIVCVGCLKPLQHPFDHPHYLYVHQ